MTTYTELNSLDIKSFDKSCWGKASSSSAMSSAGYGTIPKQSGGPNLNLSGRLDLSYLMSQRGVLKVLQIVFTLIAFICACINPWWTRWGGAWVQFVAISAFAWSLLSFFFHICNAFNNQNAHRFHVAEAILYSIFTICLLSAGIIAAIRAYSRSSIVAATIFTIMATVLYGVESILLFRDWSDSRGSNSSAGRPQPTTSEPPSNPNV
ncbi:CKLF-like MARVEL transmembrane domain-containing protein 7 isoform X1 [Octopus sinensis]|uniref:CKLF-like MARVEL transmembrane domain-containing protein 7 isoform X1 n=2 Tax=Octopus sinensis TaxID=2607531 RepID=A0A7E6FM72_9MOLL|nr:CKLF-like MARVEL transmembrane domain-containing protein 7 isoform X1 [Octopus sinensis]